MPRILLSNNHLSNAQGSEIVTLEIAQAFLSFGWEVDIFTHAYDGIMRWEFEALPSGGNLFITDDVNHKFTKEYDIIWSQQFIFNESIIERLSTDGIKTHFIFNHMSAVTYMEMPINVDLENRLATRVLSVSPECSDYLRSIDISEDAIELFDNPSPAYFSSYKTPRVESTLTKVLLITNHPPAEVLELIDILNEKNIKCDLVGKYGQVLRVVPEVLAQYDVVVTIGKSVQYALSMGIPAFIYDIYGGEGYLNESNFNTAAYHNFSGRGGRKKVDAERLAEEIITGFNDALLFARTNKDRHAEKWNLDVRLASVISRLGEPQVHYIDENEAQSLSLHAKVLKKCIMPAYSYEQWLNDREITPTRKSLLKEYISKDQDAGNFCIIIIDDNSDYLDFENSLSSIDSQTHQVSELWVISNNNSRRVTKNVNFLYSEEHWSVTINSLMEKVCAKFTLILHAGDVLQHNALLLLAEARIRQAEKLVFYFDEDSFENGKPTSPMLKPDCNVDLLRSYPYIGRTLAFSTVAFNTCGGVDAKFNALCIHDMIWRVIELAGPAYIGHVTEVIVHSSIPLLKWIADQSIYHTSQDVVKAHLQRFGVEADVSTGLRPGTSRISYQHHHQPKVSIIIPTKNHFDLLRRCIDSLMEKTKYTNYEIIIVDNNSKQADAKQFIEQLENLNIEQIRILYWDESFNFSAINNYAFAQAKGDVILFLNNDVEIVDGTWLDVMVSQVLRPEVGMVGIRLEYRDGRIQHGGMTLGLNDFAGIVYQGEKADAAGYMLRLNVTQNVSAVSASCMMMRRDVFVEAGGFSAEEFPIHLGDVDLALRVTALGFIHVWTPETKVSHLGGASRLLQSKFLVSPTPNKEQISTLYQKWLPQLSHDPAYHPALSLDAPGYELSNMMSRVMEPLPGRPLPVIMANHVDRYGCGYYRVIHPFKALENSMHIEGGLCEGKPYVTHIERLNPDVIILQPGLTKNTSQIMDVYHKHSSAHLVLDYDDYSANIPVTHVTRRQISQSIIKDIRQSCARADWLVVSTPALADEFEGFHSDIRIAQNGLSREWWGNLQSLRAIGKKPRVGWAGGSTHTGDLAIISSVVKALEDDVEWVFFGMKPEGARCEFHYGVPIEHYPQKLASLNLDLALVPLEINQFNRSKSNLRLLELGVCGVPIICTDIEPYRCDLPVTRVRNRFADWMEAIRMHLADTDEMARMGDLLQKKVKENWMLEGEHLEQWRKAWLPK